MTQTQNIGLTYIAQSQSQKHVTVNESLRLLDMVIQPSVIDKDLTSPPSSPASGDTYIVGLTATDDWLGRDGQLAAWVDGLWLFALPKTGWQAYVADETRDYVFDGANWQTIGLEASDLINVPLVGVNTVADSTNRLAVASDAVLFNHGGTDSQVKINKAAPPDTASLLFQTNFSGRAEIGLTGDDDFQFKVSHDGSGFHNAIHIDKTDGQVSFPNSDIGKVSVTTFASGSGTYAVPDKCKALKVTCCGAGGGGAGGETTSGSNYTACPGGGAGGTSVKYISAPAASYSYSVGVGGSGGSAASPHSSDGVASGVTGGESTFSGTGVSLDANGGGGGQQKLETAGAKEYASGVGGTATGGDLNITGGRGGGVIVVDGTAQQGIGYGANAMFGFGGSYNNGNGAAATGFSAGGAGAGMVPGFVLNRSGGDGAGGIIIVEEYY